MLRELIDANGLRQKDLADDLGGESIVSLILKEKRQLNRQQMEKLSHRFHVSPAVFFQVTRSTQSTSRILGFFDLTEFFKCASAAMKQHVALFDEDVVTFIKSKSGRRIPVPLLATLITSHRL